MLSIEDFNKNYTEQFDVAVNTTKGFKIVCHVFPLESLENRVKFEFINKKDRSYALYSDLQDAINAWNAAL